MSQDKGDPANAARIHVTAGTRTETAATVAAADSIMIDKHVTITTNSPTPC